MLLTGIPCMRKSLINWCVSVLDSDFRYMYSWREDIIILQNYHYFQKNKRKKKKF